MKMQMVTFIPTLFCKSFVSELKKQHGTFMVTLMNELYTFVGKSGKIKLNLIQIGGYCCLFLDLFFDLQYLFPDIGLNYNNYSKINVNKSVI